MDISRYKYFVWHFAHLIEILYLWLNYFCLGHTSPCVLRWNDPLLQFPADETHCSSRTMNDTSLSPCHAEVHITYIALQSPLRFPYAAQKRSLYFHNLSLINVNIKFDSIWTHLEAMSLTLSLLAQYKQTFMKCSQWAIVSDVPNYSNCNHRLTKYHS